MTEIDHAEASRPDMLERQAAKGQPAEGRLQVSPVRECAPIAWFRPIGLVRFPCMSDLERGLLASRLGKVIPEGIARGAPSVFPRRIPK
jgi:hypothetical protein